MAGDLAPPGTYLAGDLVAPVGCRADPSTGYCTVTVDEGPGTGPEPDEAVLDTYRVRGIRMPASAT
jgi:hypothetical protein